MAATRFSESTSGRRTARSRVMEGGDPEIIVNGEGERTTPSVVAFTDDDERLVSKPAKNQAIQNPEKTIASIKRHIGGTTIPSRSRARVYARRDLGDPPEDQTRRRRLSGRRRRESRHHGPRVLLRPTAPGDQRRRRIASFEVERIINEPTAASMAYGLDDDSGPDRSRLRPRWRYLRRLYSRSRRRRLRGRRDQR